MFSIRFHRTGSILVALVSYLLSTVDTLPAAAPMTVSQLALYQGADREKILIEGAKKEGLFTLYDSHTWFRTIAKEFEKKYPFIKVSEFRTDGRSLIKRALEEIAAGQYIAERHRDDLRTDGYHEAGGRVSRIHLGGRALLPG